MFPDSSLLSYKASYLTGAADTVSWCDVRLTKDGVGICLPEIDLANCTNIQTIYPDGKNNYIVNGVSTQGWFSVDYSFNDLVPVSCKLELLLLLLFF
jgi:hypothetical protein